MRGAINWICCAVSNITPAGAAQIAPEKLREAIGADGKVDNAKLQAILKTALRLRGVPAGVMFDTAQQIQLMAPRIQAQAVVTPIMPLGNITQMTQRRFIAADPACPQPGGQGKEPGNGGGEQQHQEAGQ